MKTFCNIVELGLQMSNQQYPQSYYPPPPPPPPQAAGGNYYSPYPSYPNYPPPPSYDSYHPKYQGGHHSPSHNSGPPSQRRIMHPRPTYTMPPKCCNAIYVKDLPYSLSVDEFQSIFSKFGEIASTFTSHIHDRGFAFVTYYDIRSAIKAVEEMKDYELHGRNPVTTFSYNPPDYANLNARETRSTILVQPTNSDGSSSESNLTPDDIETEFLKYGEINKVSEIEPQKFVVRYYDLRNAKQAISESDSIVINGFKLHVESYLEPDEGVVYQDPQQQNSRQYSRNGPPPRNGRNNNFKNPRGHDRRGGRPPPPPPSYGANPPPGMMPPAMPPYSMPPYPAMPPQYGMPPYPQQLPPGSQGQLPPQ